MPPRRKPPTEAFSEGQNDPFPPLEDDFDPEASAIADEANNTNRVSLAEHEPPPVGGFGHAPSPMGMGFGGGFEQGPMPGRPTSPTMWASAHLHESIPQVRVWKKVNGVPILVGEIDAQANEEEFIRTFIDLMPKPGEGNASFVLRPIDMNGREVREEISLPPISEHHTTLKQVRASAAALTAVGHAAPVLDLNPLHALVARQQEMAETRMRQMEDEARGERERVSTLQARLVEQQLEIAQRGAMATEAVTERMMRAESERAERVAQMEAARNDRMLEMERTRATESVNLTTGVFQQMMMMQSQASERERLATDARMREEANRREQERDEAKLRLERERLDWTQRWEREKHEDERKWAREKQAADEHARLLESERNRQHEARMRDMELQAQRDREHAERMASLLKSENKEQSVEGLLEKGTKLLSQFGVTPADLLQKVFAKDEPDGPNPLLELGMGALKEGMKVAGEYVKANAQVKAAQAQAGAGGFPGVPGFPGVAGLLPQGLPAAPFMPGATGELLPVETMPAEDAAAAQQAAAEANEPGAELALSVKKPARKAIRDLIGKLRNTPDERWEETVALAVASELSIYHYVKAVSIRYALIEAGADVDFVTRFLNHSACALIPEDVPRG
jgi:hypothetical protein